MAGILDLQKAVDEFRSYVKARDFDIIDKFKLISSLNCIAKKAIPSYREWEDLRFWIIEALAHFDGLSKSLCCSDEFTDNEYRLIYVSCAESIDEIARRIKAVKDPKGLKQEEFKEIAIRIAHDIEEYKKISSAMDTIIATIIQKKISKLR